MPTNKRSATEDIEFTPRESCKGAENENETNSDQESDHPVLATTAITNVFTAPVDDCPSMERIRAETDDWGDPVILIITRNTRDLVLEYLRKIMTDSDTTKEKEPIHTAPEIHTDETNEVSQNDYTEETTWSINTFSKEFIHEKRQIVAALSNSEGKSELRRVDPKSVKCFREKSLSQFVTKKSLNLFMTLKLGQIFCQLIPMFGRKEMIT